tara:strand:- start:85611 stop:86117 length:507 start_codon:yes stop_codon:yes gene_type:complete
MTVYYSLLTSPVGDLLLAGDGNALHLVGFPTGKRSAVRQSDWLRNDAVFMEEKRQLTAYFNGELTEFTLKLSLQGTDFQKSVWNALRAIPYGQTCSYGDIARQINRPNAYRAVGAANGQNPLPIIIPCHRVIGSTGKLTGFGGGLPTKEKLLGLEQRVRTASSSTAHH